MSSAAAVALPIDELPSPLVEPIARPRLMDRLRTSVPLLTLVPANDDAHPNAGMRISANGIALIKEFEGCLEKRADGRIHAYLCPAGVPTIGWGCTKGVKLGDSITVEEAEDRLRHELSYFEIRVAQLVTVKLTQYQFDALVSFAYNVGEGALERSTLLKQLNKGDYSSVPNQLLRWSKARTKSGFISLKGLMRRRKAEGALFINNGAKLRGETADYGPMPQKVEAEKGSRVEVLKSSRTVWRSVLALAGWIGAKVAVVSGFVAECTVEAETSASGFKSFLALVGANAETIGVTVGIVALLGVMLARLDAAAEEKTG